MTTNLLSENQSLKQYAHELQAENRARDIERISLQSQISRLQNSRKSQIQYLSPICSKCQRLEIHIQQLQQQLHLATSKTIHTTDIHPSTHQQLAEENEKLSQDKKNLQQKIQFVEKRVFALEDANRILRQEILDKMHQNSKVETKFLHTIQSEEYLSPLKIKMGSYPTDFQDQEESRIHRQYKNCLKRKLKMLEMENIALKKKIWKK